MEIQSEKLLDKLIEAISAKYGIILRIKWFSNQGYCLICYNDKHENSGTFVAYLGSSSYKCFFDSKKELLAKILNCNIRIIAEFGNLVKDLLIDVKDEFGNTLEEIAISCDFLLKHS